MLPSPRESAPVIELGFGEAGELVLGETVVVFGFGVDGAGSASEATICGIAFGLGVVAWIGARPGR